MINVGVQSEFTVSGAGRDELREHVRAVIEHLLILEEGPSAVVHSSAVSVDLGAGEVTVEIVGVGDDFDQAEKAASAAIRTAIHAAGGHTPGWCTSGERPRYQQHDARAQLIDA